MLADIARGIFGAVFGAVVEAINAWRRDQALVKLGYTAAQRDQAKAGLADAETANAVTARLRADPEYAARVRDAFTRR